MVQSLAGLFGRETLEKQQIELRSLARKPGQERMDLAAVMGLMIEPVRQSWR
jgi:hypothetical protein